MKKTLFSTIMSFGLLMSMASCSDDNLSAPGNNGEVTFNISVPGSPQSRAFADGTTAQNNVKYYVYDTQATETAPVATGTVPMSNLKGSVTITLAKTHTYDIVFLATSTESPYTYDADTRVLDMNYAGVTNSNENLDAFYNVVTDLKVSGSATTEVALTRPFAQLNIGTNDLAQYEELTKTTVSATAVTVSNIYSSIYLMDGTLQGDPAEVTFAAAALPAGETFPVSATGTTYSYLAMDYLLVNDIKDIVTVSMEVTTANGATETKDYENIPVQRNYRTNIYGALLTADQTFDIEIVPGFNDDINISTDPTEPAKDANGAYQVKTQGELEWLANQVNGGNNMSTATFSLQNDIYLTGDWTPIGGGGNGFNIRFSGKFLGNGYTIYNMNVKATERAGFFGFFNGTVEDLNFDNAHVASNHWAGVVAGYSDNETGSTYIKNCNVSNSTVILAAEPDGDAWDNGDKGGLIIGFMAARDQVENCTVTDCVLQGYRDLGGIIGYASGSVIKNNTVNGLTVYVDNSHNYKNYTTLGTGGNDANPVIGEATSSTVNEGNTSSNVTISGLVADGVTTDAEGNYVITKPEGLVWMSTQVNSGATRFSGKTIKLGGDIDMTGVEYTPCGNVTAYPSITFAGVFDGGNYTISNLTTSATVTPNWETAGLFGSITGKVQNLTLTNVNVSSTHYAGGICGYSSSNVGMAITNCHVIGGTITSAAELVGSSWDNGDKVGGIIGYAVAGDVVKDCSVENVTVQAYRDLGGIIGFSNGATVSGNTVTNTKVLVDNSHNYKNYTTIGKGGNDAGEIIGEQSGGTNDNNTATDVVVAYVAE